MQRRLTAKQHWRVATVYETAAADYLGVPRQQRVAFARKAKWFRLLARIAAKKEAAAMLNEVGPLKPHHGTVSGEPRPSDEGWRPKARYQTIAERLQKAREAAECGPKGAPGNASVLHQGTTLTG